MAKSDEEVTSNYVNQIIEKVATETGIVDSYPENKAIDFQKGDIVECTYMQGLFEVFGHTNRNLVCMYLVGDDDPENMEFVAPNFLKKTNASKNTVKVLFNE